MSPEILEQLRKATGSTKADEDGVGADVVAELAANATNLASTQAFARSAGIEFDTLLDDPEETAAAFSRDIEQTRRDVEAAKSALPKPVNPEVMFERHVRVLENIEGLKQNKYTRPFIDGLKRLAGTSQAPNAVAMSREGGTGDCFIMEVVKLLREQGPVPLTGAFAASREAPRQEAPTGPSAEQIAEWDKEDAALKERHLAHAK